MLRYAMLGAAAAALIASSAQAADLPAEVPSFSWTGAYVGVQAGYSWGKSNTRRTPPATDGGVGIPILLALPAVPGSANVNPDGFVIGGFAGYNVQLDNSPLVFGVETDLNYADIKSKGLRTKWTGATRGRVGYAMDRVMVYGAAGVAYANRSARVTGGGRDSKTAVGWTVGGGIEYAATDNILVRAEYRYSDFGKDTFRSGGVKVRSSYTEHRVMAGIAYKF